MSCFPCFGSKKKEEPEEVPVAQVRDIPPPSPPRPVDNAPNLSSEPNNNNNRDANNDKDEQNTAANGDNGDNGARTFTFRELAMATKNFKQECLIGEGGFGKVYKATLQSGEVVAVKRLDRNGTQGNKEFLVEVLMLTLLHHPNLANLIGYCADGDQRLLVYEYLPTGPLDNHLHDIPDDKKPLNWQTRMKIASGAAQGLEYLHEKANPPIIYRDLKPSNILMDEDLNPKLSDYGLAKLTQQGDTKTHISPRVMGTYGYCAPEYERNGELTLKSDVYSFGVILLELISGRRALDTERPTEEQNLVAWAQPIFRDPKRFPDMADPLLKGEFPERSLNQAVGVAAMCLQDEPSVRPLIGDVVAALSFLAVAPPQEDIPISLPALTPPSDKREDHGQKKDGSDQRNKDNKSISSSSRSSSASSLDEGAHRGQRSNSSTAPAQGNVSVDYRQNSVEESQDGSVGSSLQHRRYEESSAWSADSSSRYKSQDGSAFDNSVRQQSSMRSRTESNGSHSRQSSDSESEEGSYSSTHKQ